MLIIQLPACHEDITDEQLLERLKKPKYTFADVEKALHIMNSQGVTAKEAMRQLGEDIKCR